MMRDNDNELDQRRDASTAVNRRDLLRSATATATVAMFGPASRLTAASGARIGVATTISWQPNVYHGWPTLVRRRNGELLVVCSGGRTAHIDPFGQVELIRSRDDGHNWTWPRVVLDGPLDDRDSGILETRTGTLLATTFTSLAYEPILRRAESIKPGAPGAWSKQRLAQWRAARDRLTAAERKAQLGVWMIRSTDGGLTWSAPYDSLVNSPHGPIELADGRLLYAGKQLWKDDQRVGVCESTDDGKTWRWLADIPTRPGDAHRNYHELHAVDAGGGRIIAQIRNHNRKNSGETLQCESTDGGHTWSVPRSIGVWGLPSHLLRLKDGRLVMTYGHRRKPFGCQARVSRDQGRTWSEPIIIYGQGVTGDLGYPSTVELRDGSLLSVWYESGVKGVRLSALRQVRWSLPRSE